MERALQVGEVRSLICSYLDPEETADRIALFNLTITNRQWGTIALDILWKAVNMGGQILTLFHTLGKLRSSGSLSTRNQQPKVCDRGLMNQARLHIG
jgi:hypothetical protein